MAVFLAVFAVGFVMVSIAAIVGLDRAPAVRGRLATSPASGSRAHGSRARRRDERKASPALFLLASVFTLLAIATLVSPH